jgi:hypothetical protein
MKNLKLITLSVVVENTDVDFVSKEMENSPLAEMGYYTMQCGDVRDLTKKEIKEILSQLPEEVVDDILEKDEE